MVANKLFENVAEFIYSGMTVTNKNYVQEKLRADEWLLSCSS
jgi:hypothetical protein